MNSNKTIIIIYLFIDLLKAYKPRQPHRISSWLFTSSNLSQGEYSTKHAHYNKYKTSKHNPKVSPLGIPLVKKKKRGK